MRLLPVWHALEARVAPGLVRLMAQRRGGILRACLDRLAHEVVHDARVDMAQVAVTRLDRVADHLAGAHSDFLIMT